MIAEHAESGDVSEFLPKFAEMVAEADRDPESVPVSMWGVGDDADQLKRFRDLVVVRAVVSLPSETEDTILPELDRWADIIRTL